MMSQLPSKNGLLVFKNSRVIFSLCQVGVVAALWSCQQQRAAIAVIERRSNGARLLLQAS